MVKIVASFTTLPDRYDILEQSILSIRNQTLPPDIIYLTIPKIAKRLNKEYPSLPLNILNMCKIVAVDIDYGPITKIYGALFNEIDSDSIILSFDDDIIYPNDIIEKLVKHSKDYPEAAICATGALLHKDNLLFSSIYSTLKNAYPWNFVIGFDIPKEGRNIDLVFGVAGVLYRRRFFPPKEHLIEKFFKYALDDHAIFCNDDMLISAYLAKNNIKRKIFNDLPLIDPKNGSNDSLSNDLYEMIPRLNKAYTALKKEQFFQEMEKFNFTETPFFRIAAVLVVIIIIIIILYYII